MAKRQQQPRIVNLVNNHRKMAEDFLAQLITVEAVPKNFSGVMTPKFGNFIFVWQFHKNKLVGSAMIHVNNVLNFNSKMENSLKSTDWLTQEKEEDIGSITDDASTD